MKQIYEHIDKDGYKLTVMKDELGRYWEFLFDPFAVLISSCQVSRNTWEAWEKTGEYGIYHTNDEGKA